MKEAKANRSAFDLSILDQAVIPPQASMPAPTSVAKAKNQINEVLSIEIGKIEEDLNQSRTEFLDENLQNLAIDITRRGVRQPLTVRPADGNGKHKIINGARRYRAAKIAGLSHLPVIVEQEERHQNAYSQLLDNTKRANLNAMEIARFIKNRKDQGETNKDIAKLLSENEHYITWHLSLLDGGKDIQAAFNEGRINSIRAVHMLNKLQAENPSAVEKLLAGDAEVITQKMIEESRAGKEAASTDQSTNFLLDASLSPPDDASPVSSPELPNPPLSIKSSGEEEFLAEKSTDGVKVKKLPYHNPELDEAKKGDGRMQDPSKIRKPLLLGEIDNRPIKILLGKKPTTQGFAHIQREDTMAEEEVELGRIKLTLLSEMKVQEKS